MSESAGTQHCFPPHHTTFWERDLDNAYWNLDKLQVEAAIKHAAFLVRKHRGMRGNFFFAIAKHFFSNLCTALAQLQASISVCTRYRHLQISSTRICL